MKRMMDVIFSLVGLIALSPVLLILMIWVKCASGKGPIFYCGERVGWRDRPFKIFKFRSMIQNAEVLGPCSTTLDDPRVTPLGRFLRKSKLDELPQLLNVLVGNMSFVGPRPQIRWVVALYTEEEKNLLNVRPGITDYASLVFRNEAELLKGSKDSDRDYFIKIAPLKTRLALGYVEHHSLLIDAKIVMATIGALLGKDPLWCLPSELRSLVTSGIPAASVVVPSVERDLAKR